ncbi:unnamed protein product [Aphanomyces euteiches]|uniref:Uncharacterized protein n=1 Tax=Aphanomyces euteiches TaxID=100861 RepID=A0A6G0XB53_9STRA|nr:hypothetical protein Ae201684_006521 [Aphanomyces euteiches]KAH9091012.1 hypothetical protein Ae201684P_006413 [Aphanomyces euteiches]
MTTGCSSADCALPTQQQPLNDFQMLDKSLFVVTSINLDSPMSVADTNTLRDSIFLDDELATTKAQLADAKRLCSELQFQVKQLEAAKLLWDVTRLGMEFQVIKDRDDHARSYHRLQVQLVRTENTAKYFKDECEKLKAEMAAKDARIEAIEADLKVLQNTTDMFSRLKHLESQVEQLIDINEALVDENHVLKLNQFELKYESTAPVQRTSSWKLFQRSDSKPTSQPKSRARAQTRAAPAVVKTTTPVFDGSPKSRPRAHTRATPTPVFADSPKSRPRAQTRATPTVVKTTPVFAESPHPIPPARIANSTANYELIHLLQRELGTSGGHRGRAESQDGWF